MIKCYCIAFSVVVVLLAILSIGYVKHDAQPSVKELSSPNCHIVERDAGKIETNRFSYDFLVGGIKLKGIVSVSANCGCTELSLRKGDIFDYSTPFRVTVQLSKNQPGKGHQEFLVVFSDHTAIEGQLSYEYVPPPFVTPEELRFFEDVCEKEAIFCFPNETGVAIQEVVHPVGITWRRECENEKPHEVCLVFEIDRSLFHSDPTGSIEVVATLLLLLYGNILKQQILRCQPKNP